MSFFCGLAVRAALLAVGRSRTGTIRMSALAFLVAVHKILLLRVGLTADSVCECVRRFFQSRQVLQSTYRQFRKATVEGDV